MVLTGWRRSMTAALVIPDEQSWTVWGQDPAAEGITPVLDAGRADRLLVPDQIPDELAEAVRSALEDVPSGTPTEPRALPATAGHFADHVTDQQANNHEHGGRHEHDHGGHEHGAGHDHGDDDQHGHEDMMAITGDPSADGLVMEPIEFPFGPLASPLPGGLVADVALDGDVVAECRLRATLRQPAAQAGATPSPADLLAPASWTALIAAASQAESGVMVPARARWLRLASGTPHRCPAARGHVRRCARPA